MKVICVKTHTSGNWSSFSASLMLTVGKWYQVDSVGTDYYTVIVNKGYRANLSKQYFKTVEDIRIDKLSVLGL